MFLREMDNNTQPNELSIVIVNYNTVEYLADCVESIFNGNEEVVLEVFVVDNGSNDGSAKFILDFYPQITLIANEENIGYAAANNLAIREAKGDYLLLLNPDTLLPPHCLRKLLDFVKQHPEIGMISPKLVRPDGSLDYACRRSFPTRFDIYARLFGLDRLFPNSKLFGHYNLLYLDPSVSCEVDSVCGAFMLVRRRAVDSVGLLDERFFMYVEDIDWAYRFKQAGWIVYYYPEVEVLHYKRASSKKIADEMIVEFYRAIYQYYAKYYEPITHPASNWLMRRTLQLKTSISLLGWKLTKRWL
jgi:GT2 family glycosyltransferase